MFGFLRKKRKEKPAPEPPTEVVRETDHNGANLCGTILTSNACGGTNPDLPLQAAFRVAPETPVPAETKPVKVNRDCRIKIRFTPAELADVKQKAKEAGTDCSKYIRGKLNAAELIEVPHPDSAAMAVELNRVGRWIDEILVRANSQGFIDRSELLKALDECHTVFAKIKRAFTPDEEGRYPND